MSIFEQLRAVDDCEELRTLQFATTALPIWPLVRWLAVSAAQDKALGLQPAYAPRPPRTLGARAKLARQVALQGPLTARRTFDIVVVGSTGGIVLQRDGRWFDRINDYFTMEAPERTLALDMALDGAYKRPRFPPNVRCYDTFDIAAGALARVRRPAAADLARIDRVVELVERQFPVALERATVAQIRATAIHWAQRLPSLRKMFARFFARTRPKVMFLEGGSYGAFAHVCTWAREAGIATAELQHGVISWSHLAYNFGDAAQRDATFAACLPAHLLLYGELWRRETRTPSRVTIGGWPHFSENLRRVGTPTPRSVLVISQGICTEAMVQHTRHVASALPQHQIVFRLHPGEVAFRERWQGLAALPNVTISERGDIYDLFEQAEVVVGHSSTALFEAAGMQRPVLVLDDPTSSAIIPRSLGTWFNTSDDLIDLVRTPPAAAADPQAFFAADWRAHYRRFLASVGC